MKLFILTLLASLSASAYAAESGFVYQGKTYVVYKDGKKVGKSYQEMFGDKPREPSSVTEASKSIIVFEDDGQTRCYRLNQFSGYEALSCLKNQ